ncbi:hypothetical protein B0H12DRAFT_1103274 [Mycena haematopus]|nr:hypothetical protein B0H12DRAFT_1103274 [Mycena haematopus]
MVDGLKAYSRRKGKANASKERIDRALATLQLAEHAHVLCVEGVQDAVERLYDLTADLGVRRYKLIERSHLPFCAETHQRTGASLQDTWVKMLGQIHRITPAAATGIAAAHPTAHALFSAYAAAPGERERDALVRGCEISHRVDGVANKRPVGAALAQVVGTVMYGRDPLQLAYRAAA